MKKSALVLLLGLTFVAGGSGVASATPMPVAGTYTTGGATVPPGGTGPWLLTSTDSTYSILRFIFNSPVDFADLTDVTVNYFSLYGGIGQGTPRLAVVVDTDNDSIADSDFLIHWGPPGTFSDPATGPASTGNLLALTDVGRYDLGGIGGSAYTDRAAALTLAGGYGVYQIQMIVDSYGGNDRGFLTDGINVTGDIPESVPEPTSLMLLGSGVVACAARARRRLKK